MNLLKDFNWNALPGPEDITRIVLDNGIVLLLRSNFNSSSIVVNGYLVSGSRFDPIEKLGLANFTAACLMRGTRKFSFEQIYDMMESEGANLGFGAGVHNAVFGGRALAEDLPMVFELLSESLRYPTFPEEHFVRQKARVLAGLAIRDQNTTDVAGMKLETLLFPDHAYGRPEDGYIKTIENIHQSDLVAFHAENYHPGNMVISVVGGVDPQKVVSVVEEYLGTWSPASTNHIGELAEPVIPPIHERAHIFLPGKTQADLVIGTRGPKRGDTDYYPISLGNNILGQFGMMGRIGDVVREKAGLAYYASSSVNAWVSSGSWEISAGVNPANLDKAINLIKEELKRFVTEPVSAEELQDSKAGFIGRLPLSMESNTGVANALVNMERYNLGLDYFRTYADRVAAISADEILEAARSFLDPERLSIVSAGPESENV